jgi:hypothetical protein
LFTSYIPAFLLIASYRNALIFLCSQILYSIFTLVGLKEIVKGIPEWQSRASETASRDNAVSTNYG